MKYKYGIYSTDAQGTPILQKRIRCTPEQVREEVDKFRKEKPFLLGVHTQRIGN